MHFLRKILLFLARTAGYIWSLPYAVFAVLFLLTVYFPKSIRWRKGAFDIVVRWHLIPAGLDRTGDGDIDDPEDFRTGAQTHAFFIFNAAERDRENEKLQRHERKHVWQAMVWGPLYPFIYASNFAWNKWIKKQSNIDAYKNIWFEKQARAAESIRTG